jgi:predicted RNase H-like HicB family nuclease
VVYLKLLVIKKEISLTAIIEKEGNAYVSFCPELDIASQGISVTEAKQNLVEALELFFEYASENEIASRLHNDVQISTVTLTV